MILFLKHIAIEGPGTAAAFFQKTVPTLKVVELENGEALPEDLSGIEAIVSLGGPMNVYEEEKHPFLKAEHAFLQKVLAENVPFIGICLGSQLLAKAAGATVGKSPQKELGFSSITLTDEGRTDPLFQGLEKTIPVFQWHEDSFQIPASGVLLASSAACPHQAFRVGEKAYGLQFHVEITDADIAAWCDAYFPRNEESAGKKSALLAEYRLARTGLDRTAVRIYENFLKMVASQKTCC